MMRELLTHLSGEYLLVAACDPVLPLWLRRFCEYVAYACDWLARVGLDNEELTIKA